MTDELLRHINDALRHAALVHDLTRADEKGNTGVAEDIDAIEHLLGNDIRNVRITEGYHVRDSGQRQDKCDGNACCQENHKNNDR